LWDDEPRGEAGGGIRSWPCVTAGTWVLRGICATMARSSRTLCGSGVASPAAAGPRVEGKQACGADWCVWVVLGEEVVWWLQKSEKRG
jgi:hypothetical protein